jgi:hypothetical protein
LTGFRQGLFDCCFIFWGTYELPHAVWSVVLSRRIFSQVNGRFKEDMDDETLVAIATTLGETF